MTRPVLDCCRPYSSAGPSGWGWWHSSRCELFAGQKVGTERERGIVQARVAHPSETAGGRAALVTWLTHSVGCSCADCGYVDHWLDRDDDREGIGGIR